MKLKQLNKRQNIEGEKKLVRQYDDLEKLLSELDNKEIPTTITDAINQKVDEINSFAGSNKELLKHIGKVKSSVLSTLEKELKLVTKNLYRTRWMAIGMSAFGIPIGVAFGTSLGSMAYIGIGLPVGMAIGMAVGAGMDKKAFEEGRQLDLEIKF